MRNFVLCICIGASLSSNSQPFLDVVKLTYVNSPAGGLNDKKNPLRSNYLGLNLNLPIELKKGGDAIIVNPFIEVNEARLSIADMHIQSMGTMIGFLKKQILNNWDLLSGVIIRKNKEGHEPLADASQIGGVLLTTYHRNQFVSLKFGLYYNREFFGNYFIPLVGIDWKITAKNRLFGVLPGNLSFDHAAKRFHYGASFRALTNSYRRETVDPCLQGDCTGKNYVRVDDNQLGVFGDLYLSQRLVLCGETGYTILRRYRFGFSGETLNDKVDYKGDNIYIRASLVYRLRLD